MMKKKEEEKKDKISDMITKDSVKKDEEEKKEEKPDTRGMYAKINLIKKMKTNEFYNALSYQKKVTTASTPNIIWGSNKWAIS